MHLSKKWSARIRRKCRQYFCRTPAGRRLKHSMMLLMTVSIAFSGVPGCSRDEETGSSKHFREITIAITHWPASAPLYIAKEKGYFRDEGLSPIFHSYVSGHLGMDAVLAGKADLATCGDTPFARAALDDKPIAVIATVCRIDRAILIIARKDKGISAPDDLRGKKIGRVKGTAADFFLNVYLTTRYIDPSDVEIVDLEPDRMVDALLNGEIDAESTWAPHTTVLRNRLGDKALVLDDPDIYTMTWNIIATQDFIRNDPGTIEKFLHAAVRANEFISKEPGQTRTVVSRYVETDDPFFEKEWKDFAFSVELDQSLVLNLEDQARWFLKREIGGDRKPPNFLDLLYTDGLSKIRPEAVRIVGK
jgi:ABC-type nitrate/sulfonate/bicarbonate transport system substrate-binding protein